MPVDWSALRKYNGATLSGADVNAVFDAATGVVGINTVPNQGIQDADIPDGPNVPNELLSLRDHIVSLGWEPILAPTQAGGPIDTPFAAPTVLPMLFSGRLYAMSYQSSDEGRLYIGRNGKVVRWFNLNNTMALPLSNVVRSSPCNAVNGSDDWREGDLLHVFASRSVVLAVGTDITDEACNVRCHVELEWRPYLPTTALVDAAPPLPYARATDFTVTGVTKAALDAETELLQDRASKLDGQSVRVGARINHRKLVTPDRTVIVSGYSGYRYLDYMACGAGRPILIEDSVPSAMLTHLPLSTDPMGFGGGGLTNPPGDGGTLNEVQNFHHVLACIPVPRWTAAEATEPLVRLRGLALSITAAYTWPYLGEFNIDALPILTDATFDFATPADIAGRMIMRAYRRPAGSDRTTSWPGGGGYRTVSAVSLQRDLTLLGEKSGFSAHKYENSHTPQQFMVSAQTMLYVQGAPVPGAMEIGMEPLAAHAVLGADDLGTGQPMRPGDAVLVAVTADTPMLYGGMDSFQARKRNPFFPVRGFWWCAMFEAEACV